MDTPTLTLTEPERTRLWEHWLAAEMRANYFAEFAWIYRRRQTMATWATLCLSSGASLALMGRLPPAFAWIAPTLTLLTAAMSIYLAVAENHHRAADAEQLHAGWAGIGADYERLWESGMYEPGAVDRLNALAAREEALSRAGTRFPANHRRLLKWQDHVERLRHVAPQTA